MNCCACVSWRSAFAGRRFRGRSYLSPLIGAIFDGTTGDTLDTGQAASLQSAAETFIANMSSDGFSLLVASYTDVSSTAVTRAVVNPKVCTMRKRVNGR